jgi:hypothetical protein
VLALTMAAMVKTMADMLFIDAAEVKNGQDSSLSRYRQPHIGRAAQLAVPRLWK